MADSDDEFGEFDDAALDEMAAFEAAVLAGHKLPPRTVVSRPGLQQRDLFGGVVAPPPAKASGSGSGASASAPGKETAAKVRVTKRWDKASFAKHGWSKKNAAAAKAKAKGKGKAHASDEDGWDDEEVCDDDDDADELLDTSYDPEAELLPIKWPPDAQASKSWQYPVQADKPLRTYQYNIVHHCLFENTLVSLPTGLGKTFIAACVMCVRAHFTPLFRLADSRLAGSTSTAGTPTAPSFSSLQRGRSSRSKSRRAITSRGSRKATASSSRARRRRRCARSRGRRSGSCTARRRRSRTTSRKAASTRATSRASSSTRRTARAATTRTSAS